MNFDINAARSAGYSDDEIADYLSKENNFDLAGALSSGYTPQEVVGFLSGSSSSGSGITMPESQSAQQPLPDGVQPSQAGGGRGFVNPPMATDPQPVAPRTGFFGRLADSFGTGVEQAKSALSSINVTAQNEALQAKRQQLAQLEAAGRADSPEAASLRTYVDAMSKRQGEYIADLTQQQKVVAQRPVNAEVQKLSQAKTFSEAWDTFAKNPVEIALNFGAQSLPVAGAGIIASVVNPALGVATLGATSAASEFGSSIIEFAQKNGVDTTSREAVTAFYSNPEMLGEAKKYAATRAGIIGLVDAASGGIASKTLVPSMIKGPVARVATNTGVQMGVQGAAGGAGEAGAQIATEGKITSPGEVVAEIAGEFAGAPLEVAGMRAGVREERAKAVVNFTPADSPAKAAGLPDIVAPLPGGIVQGAMNDGATGPAGQQAAGGGQQPGDLGRAGVEPADAAGVLGPIGDVRPGTDRVDAVAGADGVLADAGVQRTAPVAGDPLRRSADTDLLARAEAAQPAPQGQPTTIWTGRAGDGYMTRQDAEVALPTRVKREPDLRWEIEQMPSGKFRLAGYEQTQETTNGQTTQPAGAGVAAATQPGAATNTGGGALPAQTFVGQPGQSAGAIADGGASPVALEPAKSAPIGVLKRVFKEINGARGLEVTPYRGAMSPQQTAASQLARMFGKTFTLLKRVSGDKEAMPNAFVDELGGRNIFADVDAEDLPTSVVVHEVWHGLSDDIKAKATPALLKLFRQDKAQQFKDRFDYTDAQLSEEIPAWMAQAISKRKSFWEDLRKEMGNRDFAQLAKVIIDQLGRIISGARDTYGEDFIKEYITDAEQAQAILKDAYAQALREQGMQSEGGQGGGIVASQRAADFADPEERTAVSTAQPWAKADRKTGYQPNSYTEKRVIDGEDIKASKTHVQAIYEALQKYNTLSGKGDASKLMGELHDLVVENLLWLHDHVKPEVRERAKLWYDGANRISNDWTKKFNVNLRQAGGILAVFSPQMDWFKNVSLAERALVIMTRHKDEAWSQGMTDWAESWLNAAADVKTKEARRGDVEAMRRIAKEGKPFKDLNNEDAAYFVRAFDEAYFSRNYRLVTPEGGFDSFVANDDGKTLASVTWGGFGAIEKAVSIFRDGSFRNVDIQLGGEHKVRNFYNNIVDPNSADGHVTIDTHAVAAALVKPLSGSATEVLHNLGGLGSTASTGASGSYALYADAYRDAAAQRGVLAREMQSITWEAVRALFPAETKSGMASKISSIWGRVKAGEITRQEARAEVIKVAGGVRAFAWEGGGTGAFAADGATSFETVVADNPADREVRTMTPKVAKDKVQVSLSAATNTIPGIKRLYELAQGKDTAAHALLQNIALDSLQHLLTGTSARVQMEPATGLYGGASEPSLALTITFGDHERDIVLAALEKFAQNFNQEQVHVRKGTTEKVGTKFDDGSYVTPVYRWELKKALDRKKIQSIIDKSGLYGLTFGDTFVEAYYVGDTSNETEFKQFESAIERAGGLLGKEAASAGRSSARLWPYGYGDGAIGYDRIRGDISPREALTSRTAQRVAEYLKGAKVKVFDQAKEITPEQAALQGEIAAVYESLPDNDLKNPRVRKAYLELSKEVVEQFNALPIKVEVLTGQGEPYKSSAEMRRDILNNNHLFIFGTTPETFGPPGADFTGHPLLNDTGLKDQNGYPLLANDLLRAVHDYYAHAMAPTQFGPRGEEAAWKNHMSMTKSAWARWALTSETRGQNSWVNFRPEVDGVPIKDREFARQKAVLMPIEYAMTGDRMVDAPMRELAAKIPDVAKAGSKPEKARITASNRARDVTSTPEFKRWFGASKAVDESGKPKVMYHSTYSDVAEFTTNFGGDEYSKFGVHVGSLEAAQNRIGVKAAEDGAQGVRSGNAAPNIMPVYVSVKNPLRLTENRSGRWGVDDIMASVMDSGVVDPDLVDLFESDALPVSELDPTAPEVGDDNYDPDAEDRMWSSQSAFRPGERSQILRDWLESQGYDGIVYTNEFEGGGDSYILFRPTQIKSATGNNGAFGPTNPDIRFSNRASQTDAALAQRSFTDDQIDEAVANGFSSYSASQLRKQQALFAGLDGAVVRAIESYWTAETKANAASAEGGTRSDVAPLRTAATKAFRRARDLVGQVDPLALNSPNRLNSYLVNNAEGIEDYLGAAPMFSNRQRTNIQGQRFTLPETDRTDAARIKLQDDALRMRRVIEAVQSQGGTVNEEQNFYDANTLMPGRVQAMMDDFRDDVIKPMIEKAAKAGIDMEELSLYAYAKHAEERNDYIASINPRMPDGGSGMMTADANQILSDVAASGKQADYDALHADLMSITETTRRVLLDEGLITQDQFDAMEQQYGNYIPLRGFENVDAETGAIRPGIGRGINVRGKETIKALGRRSRAGDLIENVIRDYQRAVVRSEKNNVAKVLLDFVLSNPDPDLWGVDVDKTSASYNKAQGIVQYTKAIDKGEDTIGVKVGGTQVYIKLADKALTRALKQTFKEEVGDLERVAVAVSGWYTTLMRNVLTRYNPPFAMVNAIRDSQSGLLAATDELGAAGAAKFSAHLPKAIAATTADETGKMWLSNPLTQQYLREFKAAGALTGGFYMRNLEDITKDLRNDLLKAGATPRTVSEKVKFNVATKGAYLAATKFLRALELAGAASENATRLALYMAARDMGKTPAQAALLAKNGTTNFNRKGEWGGALNAAYLFFNAAVQGNAQLIKTLKNPKVLAGLGAFAGAAMAMAFYGAAAGGEDDDGEKYWDKIPSYEKERNLIIMLAPGDTIGRGIDRVGKRGRYIKIPVQYGINFFPNLGYALSDVIRNAADPRQGKTPAKTGMHLASVFFGSMNPFGGALDLTDSVSVAMAVAPTVVDLPIQIGTERNSFGTPTAPFKMPRDNTPDSERMFVSQMGGVPEWLAKTMNELGGGNEKKPGKILGVETSVTPGTIKTIIAGTTGGLGTFFDQVITAGSGMASPDKAVKASNIPFLNKVYGEVEDGVNIRSANERMREVRQTAALVKAQVQDGIDPKMDSDEKRLVSIASAQETFDEESARLRKEEIAIMRSTTMTDEQKRLARDNIQAARDRMSTAVNRVYLDSLVGQRGSDQ